MGKVIKNAATAQKNGSSAEMSNASFALRQVTVRAQNTEEYFRILHQAVTSKDIRLIVTPWTDKDSNPYYWLGVRVEDVELDFKMMLNDEIEKFILAFLKGEELPEVTDFSSKPVEDRDKWLDGHMKKYRPLADKVHEKLEKSERNGKHYHSKKLLFPHGKIAYHGKEVQDILSILGKEE